MRVLSCTKKQVALCLCALLTAGAWSALVTTDRETNPTVVDPAWEVWTGGTRGDPILIYNVNDLQNMSNDLTAHYALANDINAHDTKEWNDGKGFVPVGTSANQFTGSLDGGGYEITGLYIKRSRTDYVGLLGSVGSGGTVTNLGLADADVTGGHFTGGLVGSNSGSVSDSYATGRVIGSRDSVGGLAGNNKGSVSNSYATGSVTGSANSVGGLLGDNKGSVSDSYATGIVSGRDGVGGLVGDNTGPVSNSYATGRVNGNKVVGGLVGSNWDGSVVSDCYATGNVSGNEQVGGLVGVNDKGSIENCFYDRMTTGCSDTGKGTPKTTAEMKTRSTFTGAGWDIVSFSNRDARNSEYTWNIVDGATYPFLSWEDVSHDDDHGGIRAIHVGLAFIVLFIAVAVFLFVKKNSPQARNGTPERAEIEPHPVLVPDSSFAPPPDYRTPPPEEDPPAPESFPPPMEPTPEQTGEGGQSSPDDGPSPSSTAPAAGPLSTPDLPPPPGVTPPLR